MKKVLSPIRLCLAIIVIAVFGLHVMALGQTSSAASSKKNKAESCDGALDIVPSKPMTFTRKRRPSAGEAKSPSTPTASSEAKTVKPIKK